MLINLSGTVREKSIQLTSLLYTLTDAFDFDMTVETLLKIKAGEVAEIPMYDSVNATRYADLSCTSCIIIITCYLPAGRSV